jgi:hypothetical protein
MKAYFTKLLIIISIAIITLSEPSDDKISAIPGYPNEFLNRAFGGYLDT